MHGIKIEHPLTMVASFAVLDIVLVWWLGVFSFYVSSIVAPFVLITWAMSFVLPDFRLNQER